MGRGTVNKVILIGRLGKDPELAYTPNNQPYAKFSLATNEVWRSKDGELQERTDWHNIVVWGRQAETANEYLKKGSRVYIEGSIQTREYTDNNGTKQWFTDVKAREMQFMDTARDGNAGGGNQGGGSQSAAPQGPPPQGNFDAPPDDDLPF